MGKRFFFKSLSSVIVCAMIANLVGVMLPSKAEAARIVQESVQINNLDNVQKAAGDVTGGTATPNTQGTPSYEADRVQEGTGSLKWFPYKPDNSSAPTDVYPKVNRDIQLTSYNQLSFWVHSNKETNRSLRLRLYPQNNTATDAFYYSSNIPLDWTGWKQVEVPLADIMSKMNKTPAPWGTVDFIRIDALAPSGTQGDPDLLLYLDDFRVEQVLDIEPVQADQPSGQYPGALTVALSTPTDGAAVWYQRVGVDGDYQLYSGPLVLEQTTQLLTKAVLGEHESEVVQYNYEILEEGQVGAVVAEPAAGTFIGPVSVTLSSATDDADIYYRVSGTDEPFVPYDGPIAIGRTQTIVAKAVKDGTESEPTTHAYVIRPEPAVASVASGEYVGEFTVTLSTATPGATIQYKLGGQPDFVPYTGPIAIAQNETLTTRSMLGETAGDEMAYNYTVLNSAYKEVSNTETFTGWTNTTRVDSPVKEGEFAGKWTNTSAAVNVNDITVNWEQFDQLEFWAYSGLATGNKIYIIIDTDDTGTTGYDYYIMPLTIDWTGWKRVTLSLSKFTKSTANTFFSNYRRLIIHPRWYATDPEPNPGTELIFDGIGLSKKMIELSSTSIEKFALPGSTVKYSVSLQNKGASASQYEISIDPDRSFGAGYTATTPGVTAEVPAGGELEVQIDVQVPASAAVGDTGQAAVIIQSVQNGATEETLLQLRVAAEQAEQQHPYVLVTAEQLEQAKTKADKYDWAQDYVDAIVQKADEWIDTQMYVPDKPGGHAIWYYCGDTPLIYDYTKPHEHVCPDNGQVYSGGDYDFAWRGQTHRRNIDAVRYMALAYMFTDDMKYAQKAKDLLVQYANYYPSYPVQTRFGRLFWQTLDEAVQIIKLAQAYDVVYNSGLFSAAEKFDIENNLFRKSAETLKGYDMTISNWQTWHNAAIGVIGALLDDEELIDYSINGKSGFRYQMNNSVLSDGFWWEGAINYHFYSQQALFVHAETLKHVGIDLFSDPTLKRTFDVTLEYAFPDLGIINNNDSNNYPTNLAGGRDQAVALDYEGLYAHYGDPAYGALLNQIYSDIGRSRGGFNHPDNPYIINGEQAVLYGREVIDAGGELPSDSKNFEGIGHAVLRSGHGEEQTYALVDYGLHGASHGNFDKLHLEVFGYGERLAPDPGVTSTYGVSLYQEYYKKTFSHNTVVVDKTDQAIQKDGTQETFDPTRLFLDSSRFKVTSNSASKAYPGLSRYERTVAMTPDYMLDIFTVDSASEHQYDYVLHGVGEFTSEISMDPLSGNIGTSYGYQYFRGGTQASISGTADSRWVTDQGNGLRWISLNDAPSTLYAGELPGPASSQDYAPAIVNRMQGTGAQFVSILEPYQGDSKIAEVQRLSGNRIGVELKDGKRQVLYYSEDPAENEASYYYADGAGYDMGKVAVGAELNGQTLELDYTPVPGVLNLTAVFYAPDAQKAVWNGKELPHTQHNGYMLVELLTPTPPTDPGDGPADPGDGPVPTEPAIVETPDGVAIKVGRSGNDGNGTVTVPAAVLAKAVEALDTTTNAPVLTIEVEPAANGSIRAALPASALAEASGRLSKAILEVTGNGTSYRLPLNTLDLQQLADNNGLKLEDMEIVVTLEPQPAEAAESVQAASAAEAAGATMLAPLYDFGVSLQAGENQVELNDFGGQYITRTIEVAGGIDPAAATGVLFDPLTKQLYFVPTVFSSQDGVTVAELKRPGNSYYTVIESKGRTFADIQAHWSRSDVELMAGKLLVNGISDSEYKPERAITRAEFAALLVRAMGVSNLGGALPDHPFDDVQASDWYAADVAIAYAKGWINGVDAARFAPQRSITREEAAAMMERVVRSAGQPQSASSGSSDLARFADGGDISAWSRTAVGFALQHGLMQGVSEDRFAPRGGTTRAQAAVILKRMLQLLNFMN